MKMKFFTFLFLAVTAYFILSSRSGGAGSAGNLEKAGVPGTGTCGDCHSGGAFNPTTSISFRNSQGQTVNQIIADSIYNVTVTITAGAGNPSRYGFQAIMVSDSANQNCGSFLNLGAGQDTIIFTNGRIAVEHSTPSTVNNFSFQWKAPAYIPGSTTRLYVSGLATNGNGGTSGDANNATSIQLTETFLNPTSINAFADQVEMSLFPNPVINQLHLKTTVAKAISSHLAVYNQMGQLVHTELVELQEGEQVNTLELSQLPAGLYRLQLSSSKGQMTQSFVKF
jgi:hypothetical protein